MSLKPTFPRPESMLREVNGSMLPVLRGVGHSIPEPPPNVATGPGPQEHVVLGVRELHSERFAQYRHLLITVPSGLAAGSEVIEVPGTNIQNSLPFYAQLLIVDNPTGYVLFFPDIGRFVLANTVGNELRCVPAIQRVRAQVQSGTQATAQMISVTATEEKKFTV